MKHMLFLKENIHILLGPNANLHLLPCFTIYVQNQNATLDEE